MQEVADESLPYATRAKFHEAIGAYIERSCGASLGPQGDVRAARNLLQESLAINRELGDRWSIANSLSSLGDVALSQKDFDAALAFLEESLAINQELSDRRAIAFLFEFFAELAAAKSQPRRS